MINSISHLKTLLFSLIFLAITPASIAQFSDDFTDGDFTTNPTWSGDNALFTITSGELNSQSPGAATYYLSTSSTLSANAEWIFDLNLKFGTSGANYVDVFLMADLANLTTAQNGYFVRIGSTQDDVKLYSLVSGTETVLIDGADGSVNSTSNNPFQIKVTRDASDNWTLLYDDGILGSYTNAGSVVDNVVNSSSFFGVLIEQSGAASPINNHFFDNFYCGVIGADLTPPSIDSVVVVNANNLDVYFNEVVEINSSQTLTNYSADNGLGNPSTAIRDVVDSSIVHLTFATAFTNGLTNQLTTSNVEDNSGNAISSLMNSFTYLVIIPVNYKDVVINEIFADPSPQVGLPDAEFVELYNTSSNTYNLNAWNFINSTTSKTLPNFVLMPNSYVILCSTTDTALYSSYGDVIGISSFTALTNGGDSLTLTDNSGTIVDIVNYDLSWYNDPNKDDGGYTLELINPTSPCASGSGNWSASANVDGGTPGTQNSVFDNSPDLQAPTIQTVNVFSTTQIEVLFNETMDSLSLVNATYGLTGSINVSSVTVNTNLQGAQLTLAAPLDSSLVYTLTINNATDCSGNLISPNTFDFGIGKAPLQYEVVITELFPDPSPTIGLPEQEYLELYNNTSKIIDLSGCWISDLSSANQIASGKIFPGEYVIICDDNNEGQFIPYGKVITVSSLPSLNNTDEVYSLWDADSNLIHSVHYFDSWYNDVNKKDGGWSLEMIDYNNPCGEEDNWSASTKWFGGTPGAENSIYANNPDNLLPEVVSANAINDSTVLVSFNEAIQLGSVSIDNGINIFTISVIDNKNIQLNLSDKLQGQIIYTVTVFGAYDCVGNTIGANNSAEFALPEQGSANDLVINEVLFDPYTGGSDFVELYNNSDKYINLENWKLANLENDSIDNYKIISDVPYLLRPQEFVLLSVNTASVKQFYFNAHEDVFLQMASLPTYSNDEGNVYLINNLDEVVDAFSYDEDMHFALLNSVDGVSLERIDYNRPTNDKTNWHSASEAVGFATPGYENSQYLEAETGSEITISPESFSPDNDGFDDVVNIAYQFNESGYVANVIIYDSKGRLTKNLVKNEYLGTQGTFSWDGIDENNEKAAIGIYIIYLEVFSESGDVKKFKKPCVVAGRLN
ncbi:MAG: lamin tail domain-containing protein [Flavobacteriales bacterium]|nr:lamin tail domain-containing protein [Flavobacteriales bacterium]